MNQARLQKYSGIITLLSIIILILTALFLDQFFTTMKFSTTFIHVPLFIAWLVLGLCTYFSTPYCSTAQKPVGIHQIIRNPLITINCFLLYPALAFFFHSYTALIFTIIFFIISIFLTKIQDAYLTEVLGDYYLKYKKKVGIFIPKLM